MNRSILLISLGIITFFVNASGYTADTYVLKFATIAPEGTTWMNTMEEMNNEIQETSGGRLKLRFYPGGVMGDELDVLRKMRINQVHGGGFSGVGLGEILPEVRVLDVPYLFRSYEEVDSVHNKVFDAFSKKFESNGYILMGWAEVGFVHIFSKDPVNNLSELRKVKLWSWQGDPIAEGVFSNMRISTIPLPVTDVLTSLQVGLIDTVYSPPLGALALQWYTRVKYMNSFPITHSTGAVLVSRKFYDKLPLDLQKILNDAFKKHLAILINRSRTDNRNAKETLKQNGIEFITPAEEAKKEYETEAHKASRAMAGKLYSEELLNKVTALVEEKRNEQ